MASGDRFALRMPHMRILFDASRPSMYIARRVTVMNRPPPTTSAGQDRPLARLVVR